MNPLTSIPSGGVIGTAKRFTDILKPTSILAPFSKREVLNAVTEPLQSLCQIWMGAFNLG